MIRLIRPSRYLYVSWATMLAGAGFMVWLALQVPSLGMRFALSPSGTAVVIAGLPVPAAVIPQGAEVLSLQGGDERIELRPQDILDEPDLLDSYATLNDFFSRQARFDEVLHASVVKVQWQHADGTSGEALVRPETRALRDLPGVFWFQLATGLLCFFIASWIFVLRPQEWGARMFLLTGLALPLSIFPAALYSTRELALPETLFRLLSALNHFGATAFGMALVALFACYPRRLFHPRYLWLLPLVFVPWFIADTLQWMPNTDWGARYPLILELVLAIVLAAIQWRHSRAHLLDRAALRWFSFSVLVGCSLVILVLILPSAMGLEPLLSQGYAFGFFLIMYAGIALGLRKHRLFDLNEWAYRILLWVAGAAAVVLLDILLLLAGVTQGWSLGVALFVAGWLYFPVRQWLWQRLVNVSGGKLEALMPHLSMLAFEVTEAAREAEWDRILQRLFEPIEIRHDAPSCGEAQVQEGGLALCLPAVADLRGRQLRFAALGQRLFSSQDARFAVMLCQLVEQIMSGRMQYEQGVQQERLRLARDLHDNLGARLLRLIHHLQGKPEAQIARDAIKELRSTISALDAPPAPLQEALADWRAEAEVRCVSAQAAFAWHQDELPAVLLPARTRATVGSILRELISNALKHAKPSLVKVVIRKKGIALQVAVENDGSALPPASWQEGFGLRNIRARLLDLGGSLEFSGQGEDVSATLSIPLHEAKS